MSMSERLLMMLTEQLYLMLRLEIQWSTPKTHLPAQMIDKGELNLLRVQVSGDMAVHGVCLLQVS
ncbi:UNVERIFIED_CONTAM: hypothetical protein HHA_453870 [Hammondia hammondi]|eukprot:XP_008887247.1 hypothetical protein HHA_453870 [Hammondia hammondi]